MTAQRWRAPVVMAMMLAASQTSAQAASATRATLTARVDSLMRFLIEDGRQAGASVAVFRGSDTLVYGGWGNENVAAGRSTSAGTVYHIGSITKQFTATLVMRLVERGRVRLADSIGTHLATLPPAWRGLTVLELLNHTSGLADYAQAPSWTALPRPGGRMAPDSIARLMSGAPFDFPPGTQYAYSNTGYLVLAMLVEGLYGRPYADVLQAELARPLGLTHTAVCDESPDQALGYDFTDSALTRAPVRHISNFLGAGDICSTVGDLAQWNRALHGGKVVNATSYHAMTTPEGAAAANPAHYGIGLHSLTMLGKPVLEHSGGWSGFLGENIWFPGDSLSITVLTNTMPMPQQLPGYLGRIVLGLPVTIPAPGMHLDAAALTRFAGVYRVTTPTRQVNLLIQPDGKRLLATLDGQGPLVLAAAGRNSFGTAGSLTVRMTFAAPTDGAAPTGMAFEQNGQRYDASRTGALPIPSSAESLAPYVGGYSIRLGAQPLVAQVTLSGSSLRVNAPGVGTFALHPLGGSVFRVGESVGMSLTFIVENGVATRLILEQDGELSAGARSGS